MAPSRRSNRRSKGGSGDLCRCAMGFVAAVVVSLPIMYRFGSQYQVPKAPISGTVPARSSVAGSSLRAQPISPQSVYANQDSYANVAPAPLNRVGPVAPGLLASPVAGSGLGSSVVRTPGNLPFTTLAPRSSVAAGAALRFNDRRNIGSVLKKRGSSAHLASTEPSSSSTRGGQYGVDGTLNATEVGHTWALLPCAADQACARAPTNLPLLPRGGVAIEPSPPEWYKAHSAPQGGHASAVSQFVLGMSLDVLRDGGTGEARLRARRHSAYGPSGGASHGGSAKSAVASRCTQLMKPSATEQLRGVLKNAERRRVAAAAKNKHSTNGTTLHGISAETKFVSFTITDATYGDMLNDVWAGVHRLGLEDTFFYVALDKPTALAACHHHMPTVYFSEPLQLPPSKAATALKLPQRNPKFTSTKDRVYEAKYGLAILMARERTNFLFFEMDCWLLQHPLRAVHLHPIRADMYISLHQDNPFEYNVGYYYVEAEEPKASLRVERFFVATLAYLRTHPDAFDQKLINCLMKSYASQMDRSYVSLFSRAGCKGQKISLDDPSLEALTKGASKAGGNQVMTWALLEIDDILSSATPLMSRDTSTLHVLTNVPLTAASGKKVVAKELMVWEGAYCYYCVGSAAVGMHSHVGLHGPKGLIAGGEEEGDRLNPLGVHEDDEAEERLKSSSSSSSPKGSKSTAATAAEAAEAAKAAALHAAPRRRYLAYDGPLIAHDLRIGPEGSGSSKGGRGEGYASVNHVEVLAAAVLQLVGLAVYTGRTLVLPVLQHDGRFLRTWEILDLVSAEQFVEWRETSFLRNPRLLVSSDATACRALLSDQHATLEHWRWGDVEAPITAPKAYAYDYATSNSHSKGGGGGELSARERAWVVLESAPEAAEADLLLVQFDKHYNLPEAACFRKQGAPCAHLLEPQPAPQAAAVGAAAEKNKRTGLSKGHPLQLSGGASAVAVAPDPPWLLVLGATMRWCGLDKVKIPNMAGIKALDDCFAASERAMAKNYGVVTQEWSNAASGRCAVAAVQRAVEGSGGGDATGEGKSLVGKKVKSKAGAGQLPMPYALGVAHLLRNRGGSKKVTAMFEALEPKALRDFATAHNSLMRAGKKDSGC